MKRITAIFLLTQLAIVPQLASAQDFSPPAMEPPHPEAQGAPHPARQPFLEPERPGRSENPNLVLASHLNAMETYLGIAADQQDVWRHFASALIDIRQPPKSDLFATPEQPMQMLSLLDKEADAVIARGKNAEKLKEALAEMKASLHPAQLEKLQMLGELLEPFQKAPTSKFQPAFGKRPAGFPPEPPRP